MERGVTKSGKRCPEQDMGRVVSDEMSRFQMVLAKWVPETDDIYTTSDCRKSSWSRLASSSIENILESSFLLSSKLESREEN